MEIMDMLQITHNDAHLIIDARDAIRKGIHPRFEILKLVDNAPNGTLCEIFVPHRTGPLIAALKDLGLNVVTSETEPGTWRIRVMKI